MKPQLLGFGATCPLRSMVQIFFGFRNFSTSALRRFLLGKSCKDFLRSLDLAPRASSDQTTHAHYGFRDFGPLKNNFNNISNPLFPRTADLIFSGMSVVEADLACCLCFEPEMDCYERCALMFLAQAMNLDNLLPLTTICDNIWLHRGWHALCKLPRTSSSSRLMHWAMELCSKNILLRIKGRQAHYPKNERKIHGL